MSSDSGKLQASVAIRRAHESDSSQVSRVEASAKLGVSDHWQAGAPDYFQEEAFTYLSEDESPFGFVTSGSPREEYFCDGLTGEILHLYIHPEYQGFGYGKKLLVHGLTVLKRRGFESAIAWVPEIADRANATVASLNFELIDGARLTDNSSGGLEQACHRLDLTDYF